MPRATTPVTEMSTTTNVSHRLLLASMVDSCGGEGVSGIGRLAIRRFRPDVAQSKFSVPATTENNATTATARPASEESDCNSSRVQCTVFSLTGVYYEVYKSRNYYF